MQYIDIARNPKLCRHMRIILLKNHAKNKKELQLELQSDESTLV